MDQLTTEDIKLLHVLAAKNLADQKADLAKVERRMDTNIVTDNSYYHSLQEEQGIIQGEILQAQRVFDILEQVVYDRTRGALGRKTIASQDDASWQNPRVGGWDIEPVYASRTDQGRFTQWVVKLPGDAVAAFGPAMKTACIIWARKHSRLVKKKVAA